MPYLVRVDMADSQQYEAIYMATDRMDQGPSNSTTGNHDNHQDASHVPGMNHIDVPLCMRNINASLSTSEYEASQLECGQYGGGFIAQKHIELTALSVIFCSSLISNIMAFIVFYRRPRLLSVSNRFVLNLAISNFLMTVFVIPLVLISTATDGWLFGSIICDISGTMVTILFSACNFTLLSISIDRYYAIVRPLHYPIRLTKKRSYFYICIVWTVAIAVGIAPLFGIGKIAYNDSMKMCVLKWDEQTIFSRIYTYFLSTVCFLLPFLTMLWVYVVVFRVAHRTSERARRHSVIPEYDSPQHTVLLNNNKARRSSSMIIRSHASFKQRRSTSSSIRSIFTFHKDDWKAAKTGLVCMSTFSVCWFPFFVLIVLKASMDKLNIPSWVETAVLYSALLGCVLNPIVYVFRSRLVLRECKNIVSRRKPAFMGTLMPRSYMSKDVTSSGLCTPLAHMTPNRSCPIFRYSSEERASVTMETANEKSEKSEITCKSPDIELAILNATVAYL